MRRRTITCCALIAVSAFCACASASASAAELPEFKTETNGRLTGGSGELTSRAVAVKCEKLSGEVTKGKTKGTYTLTFSECKEPKLKLACKSLGDPYNSASKPENGTILTGGTWDVVPALEQETTLMLFLVTELHIECSNATLSITLLFLLKGDVLGLITPLNTQTEEFRVEVETTEKGGTIQRVKEFENSEGGEVDAKLESSVDGGTVEAAGENSSASTLTMEKQTELIFKDICVELKPDPQFFGPGEEKPVTIKAIAAITPEVDKTTEETEFTPEDPNKCLKAALAAGAECSVMIKHGATKNLREQYLLELKCKGRKRAAVSSLES